MIREEYCVKIMEAIENINFIGDYDSFKEYGNGHINDTFIVYMNQGGVKVRYILQRINHNIFKRPELLMENIHNVTTFIKRKINASGGDIVREVLNLIPTKGGKSYYKDSIGTYWRAYLFIEDVTSLDNIKNREDFYQSAVAFGHFQELLYDYPVETLHETITDFHNTPMRLHNLKNAINEDRLERVNSVKSEIDFILKRENDTRILMDLYREGKLPLKVTHNDTKLNNVLIDNKTRKGICVIDLDTVMPGFSVNDFGDSIRFGANTGTEDEPDLSKVELDLDLFKIYTKGFLHGCNGRLSDLEINLLPVGAKLMTLESGIRFLTDYLEGDTYFKIQHKNHNLDRARTQLKLVKEMEDNQVSMNDIIKQCR